MIPLSVLPSSITQYYHPALLSLQSFAYNLHVLAHIFLFLFFEAESIEIHSHLQAILVQNDIIVHDIKGAGVDCVKEYVAKYKQLKRTMYCVG